MEMLGKDWNCARAKGVGVSLVPVVKKTPQANGEALLKYHSQGVNPTSRHGAALIPVPQVLDKRKQQQLPGLEFPGGSFGDRNAPKSQR